MATRVRANPFPGLRPFMQEEADLFFGRDKQTDELVRRLATRRFVAVVGTSGSGKSSLVRAGLLPSLEGGFMASAGAHWRMAVLRPQDDPIGYLARAIVGTGVPPELELTPGAAEGVVETTLRRSGLGLVEAARLTRMEPHENLLVVVDQFEELFRFADLARQRGAADEAPAFVRLLLEGARQTEVSLYVVITMRSDFLGDCARFRDLPEAISESQYLIPRLTRDELQATISGPIGVRGGRIAPSLVQRLLNDVGDDMDQLPVLQHALMRAWDHWERSGEDRPIELADLEAIGGMAEALSRHADEAYWSLASERDRKIVERVFKCLTEKGPDNREIRRPTPLARLAAIADADSADIVRVIDVFRAPGRSFLMPPHDVDLDGDAVIDISHESLIRKWTRLRAWVEEEAESRAAYLRLVEAARLWQAGRAGLWGEIDLASARQWQDRELPNAEWAARYGAGFAEAGAFLQASEAARAAELDRERQRADAERLARERELEQARALADAQRQRADAQAAASARQRRMIWALAGILGLAVCAAVFGWHQRNRAQEGQRIAEEQTAVAEKQTRIATDKADEAAKQRRVAVLNGEEALRQKGVADQAVVDANRALDRANQATQEAIDARGEAQRQTAIATARRLATEALYRFGLSADALAVSGNLALESLRAHATPEGHRALAQVLRLIPLPPEVVPKVHDRGVRAVAWSRDGRWMASAGDFNDGTVILWDLAARQRRVIEAQFRSAPSGLGLAFSDDGRWLAAGGMGGLWLWATDSGAPAVRPIPHANLVRSVAFSPDGLLLATATRGSGQIRIFERKGQTWEESGLSPYRGPAPGDRLDTVNSAAFVAANRLALAGERGPGGQPGVWFVNMPSMAEQQLEFRGIAAERPGLFEKCRALTVTQDTRALAALCSGGILVAKGAEAGFHVAEYPNLAADEVASTSWGLAVGPDGASVALVTNVGDVLLYGNPIATISKVMRSGPAHVVAFRPDGRVIAAGLRDGSVAFWPVAMGGESVALAAEGGAARLAFSPDGARLVAVADDGRARVFDVSAQVLPAPASAQRSFAVGPMRGAPRFTPDGRFMVIGGGAGVQVFEASAWKKVTEYDIAEADIAITPDGRFLVALEPERLRRFDTATWRERPMIAGRFADGPKISSDGQLLATVERTRRETERRGPPRHISMTRVWRIDSGNEVAWKEEGREAADGPAPRASQGGPQGIVAESAKWTPLRTVGKLQSAQVESPDGEWSVVLVDRTAVLRDARSRREIAKLEHDDVVVDAAFGPGGRWLATSSRDGRIRLWPLQVTDLASQACRLLPRNLTREEWKDLGLAGPYRQTCPGRP